MIRITHIGRLFLGTSGFSYAHWKGNFYPPGTPGSTWLEYYASRFDSLELNVTFYRLPSARVFEQWATRTPAGFSYVVKGSRTITHYRRLHDVEAPLGRLFERAAVLGDKLGCFLWQFPPLMEPDTESLIAFCRLLASSGAGAGLAASTRHAFEFRDPRWFTPEVLDVLRAHAFALVFADPRREDQPQELTAGFAYLRFHHGPRATGAYEPAELKPFAEQTAAWLSAGKDVFAYFNNDPGGWAPRNADEFRARVASQSPREREPVPIGAPSQ